jgi:ferredoxin
MVVPGPPQVPHETKEVRMRIKVDLEKCIGAGQCVNAAPTVFAQNEDDGMVVLLDETPSDDKLAGVRSAIRLCPARAVLGQDDGGPAKNDSAPRDRG